MSAHGPHLKPVAWSFGLIAAAAIAEVAGVGHGHLATIPIFAKGLEIALGHVGGGMLHHLFDGLQGRIRERMKSPKSAVHNHDLQALAGRAAAVCVAIAAEDYAGSSSGKAFLVKLADALPHEWEAQAALPALRGVSDENLFRVFRGRKNDDALPTSLTPDVWEKVLGSAAFERNLTIDADALSAAAESVHMGFSHAVIELAKADAAPGATGSPHEGKAFAAVLLGLLRNVTGDLSSIVKSQKVNDQRMVEVLEAVRELQKAIGPRADDVVRNAPPELKAELQALREEIRQRDATLLETLRGMDQKLDEIGRSLEGLNRNAEEMNRKLDGRLRPESPPSTVPTPSLTFVPRQALTAQIHKKLQEHPDKTVIRQVVARAFGGYGKTVAAILYADEYKAHYPGGRFFLRMEQGDIIQQLASLTTALGIASANNPTADAEKVKATLEGGESSLLILDNVEHKAAWEAMRQTGFVPRGRCRVLITTRDEHVAPGSDIQVGRLAPDEAREVYRLFCEGRKARDDDAEPLPSDATADAITAWLGGLAVAVAAVAALLRLKPRLSWEVYWNGDGKGFKGLKERALSELPDVSPDVFAALKADDKDLREHRRTLHVIDQAFDALPQAERRAVEYAALLPADLAPAVWLEKLLTDDAARADGPMKITLSHDPNEPGTPTAAMLAHLDALDILLSGGEGGKLLNLHRLWHARVNERAVAAKVDRDLLLHAIAACAHARGDTIVGSNPDGTDRGVNNPASLTDQTLRWELTPLAAVCTHLWSAGEAGGAARVGVWLGYLLRLLGRYTEAAACLAPVAQHEAAVEAAIGPRDFAACYSNLALIQQDQGDLPGARASMERAIAIATRQFPPDYPTLAISYSNLAMIQLDQGDLLGARASMEGAITIASKHLGPEHPNLATMSSNLATIQHAQGNVPGARASMERAIAIDSKHFAPDHPTFGTRYSNLAAIQKDQGDVAGARESIERAIAIESKHFAPDHPTVAVSWSNLATIQQNQGDLPGARASIERAIAIKSKHLAPDHPTFGISYTNLAAICYAEGDRAAACANYTKALTIFLKHFDENHPHVKSVRRSMKVVRCPE